MADIRDLERINDIEGALNLLAEERRKRYVKLRNEKARRECLAAGLLLRRVLGMHGVDLKTVHTSENGKPEAEGICFNLSHSGNVVICAVSKANVGCDIEKVGSAPKRVAERFFCEDEISWIESFANEEKNREFFRIWTMKESYLKMTGEGLRTALNSFRVLPDSMKISREGNIQPCLMKEYKYSGYQITVCAMEEEFTEEIKQVELP
ncbi:MAG: 4'-phosphopantetheinyl transferase family protein [Bariatricus sp.]